MAGNSFGTIFRVTTFGESHGTAIGVVIDGCPPLLPIDINFIQAALDLRRPGQSGIVTPRNESDTAKIISGVMNGVSTGTPIAILIENKDARPQDYQSLQDKFRPSHADFTYQQKYGIRDASGGGRASARETVARVAAGAVAQLLLNSKGIHIHSFVSQVGEIGIDKQYQQLDFSLIEATAVRCPDMEVAKKMIELIEQMRDSGDTIGGIITTVIQGSPVGLGEPVFDRLQADLAKAVLSIQACKGFDYGAGFEGVGMKGSEQNDVFIASQNVIQTKTNYSGGIQGGISNGMDIYFRAVFKPVSTIKHEQQTVNVYGESTTLAAKGRHDPCVLPRAVPIVQAMAAITLTDHFLRNEVYGNGG
ncbi:MAG: chorismate synthase [Saprospiraceae bacterium]|nr:chorismate synthase [Saprospiraceae bacterium]MBP7699622.1 chorismate synthase [Saprospiraceae bacterium]